jgi:hypothetical protein
MLPPPVSEDTTVLHEASIVFRIVRDASGAERLDGYILSDELKPDMDQDSTISLALGVALQAWKDFLSGATMKAVTGEDVAPPALVDRNPLDNGAS